MAGAKCLLQTPGNFQSSVMFDAAEATTDTEGVSSEGTLGSSVTACKKVLCSGSLLDSTEYWLRSDKPLCHLSLLERSDRSCTTVCFVNLDCHGTSRTDESCIKRLASISPELPRLIESLGVRQPKDNEVLLLSGLQPPEPCATEPVQPQGQRAVDVCVVQCSGGHPFTQPQPTNLLFHINKFLIGLHSGQQRQRLGHLDKRRGGGDDDTNRSVSSIEEDFLTASEHLGEDSEDDHIRNEGDGVDVTDVASDHVRGLRPSPRYPRATALPCGPAPSLERNDSEDSGTTLRTSSSSTRNPRESAGRYATNLAESVLQDAFIRLSQEEAPFSPGAALSVPSSSASSSFRLPKIVIVQSPDGEEGAGQGADWTEPGAEDVTPAEKDCPIPQCPPPPPHHQHHPHHQHRHHHPHSKQQHQRFNQETKQQVVAAAVAAASKPVEVALACAATVIGTISTPQVAECLALEATLTTAEDIEAEQDSQSEEEEDNMEDDAGMEESDFSVTSAMCGMAQVAGAVAAVDLPFDPSEAEESESVLSGGGCYSPSLGLLSAAHAGAAVPLHASLAEGNSVEASRTNLARALFSEAASLLATHRPLRQQMQQRNVVQLLESTQRRLVAGLTGSEASGSRGEEHGQREGESSDAEEMTTEDEERGVEGTEEEEEGESEEDEFVRSLAEGVLAHALEKAEKRRELECRDKDDAPDGFHWDSLLRESTEGILFAVLRITTRRLGHASHRTGYRSHPRHYSGNGNAQSVDVGGGRGRSVMEMVSQPESSQSSRKTSGDGVEALVSLATEGQQQDGHAKRKEARLPSSECSPRHERFRPRGQDSRSYSSSPQHSVSEPIYPPIQRTPVTCFAEDLAATVVSMATELAAICLENSSGKQPWFCALKGVTSAGPGLEASSYLLPSCRAAAVTAVSGLRKKHRPPRLSEIKRKTEEQPELMERLVNRVVEETINLDPEPVGTSSNGHHPHNNHLNSNTTNGISDPFALFASEVTARILNCPELNVVDTSSFSSATPATGAVRQPPPAPPSSSATSSPCPSSPRGRLQCERWSSRGKAASCESIPEEEPSGQGSGRGGAGGVTLGPGMSRLGPDLSRGSSVSKQSSCESITDEFSRFMVGQMEAEGRGFDLLLDYYAGKSANTILQAALQQASMGGRRNGHLSLRSSSCCLSKQSSTESITEEFYRYMLRNMDRDGRPDLMHFGSASGSFGSMSGLNRAKEWSNSLLPPSPSSARSLFCIRQSSVPDRRSSDSRLSVTAPIKANSFDGCARGPRGGSAGSGSIGGVGDPSVLSVRTAESASAAGLCKSDSCLYRLGQTDRATDMLIHDTWSSSIEALMRKNKIITDPSDNEPSEPNGGMESLPAATTPAITPSSKPTGVCNFASRLAADIVEGGRSAALGTPSQSQHLQQQQEANATRPQPAPVGERRQGFKQSRPLLGRSRPEPEQPESTEGSVPPQRGVSREVPLIHIEPEQKEESGNKSTSRHAQQDGAQRGRERTPTTRISDIIKDKDNPNPAQRLPLTSCESEPPQQPSLSNSSEESSSGSWAQVVGPDDDLQEETSSFLHLSEGNGNSSASSLGQVDLEMPQEFSSPRASEEAEKKDALKENLEDTQSSPFAAGSSGGGVGELLVLNIDLEATVDMDVELRAALQWMAASELGASALHFRRVQQHNAYKFQRVVQLVSHKCWRLGDLFGAVVRYCQLQQGQQQETAPPAGLFDWLLETR